MLGSTEVPPQRFRQRLLGSVAPAQEVYLARKGTPSPYANNADAGAYTMGQAPPIESAVNALHMQKYGGGRWNAPRATGTTATPTVFANGLAEAKITRVMGTVPIPKYSGNPEDVDDERTWNRYIDDSTMGCNEAQWHQLCLSMHLHCVPANAKKELVDWLEDGKKSICNEMLRACRKEEVAALPHHAQPQFRAVS